MREYYNKIISGLNAGKTLETIVHEMCPEIPISFIQEELKKIKEHIKVGEQVLAAFQSENLDDILAKLRDDLLTEEMDDEEQKGCVLQLKQVLDEYLFQKESTGEEFYEIVFSELTGKEQLEKLMKKYEKPLCHDGVCHILHHTAEKVVSLEKAVDGVDEKMAAAVSVYVYGKKTCPQQDLTALAGVSTGVLAEAYRETAEDVATHSVTKISQKTQNRFFLAGVLVLLAAIGGGGMLGKKLLIAKGLRDSLAWVLFEVTFAGAAFVGAFALAFVMLEMLEEKTAPEAEKSKVTEREEYEYEYDSALDKWTNEMIEVWD